ncbi:MULTISPECIES: DUF4259 domain-containing protein [Kitasatospora]|uniref:DUF4259 domain-containing protein n=1 Tax=Kitasatospora setae (strain ATCC 33774 / DSM 43861 / JCM 3304 / KCC A-0304 / NBRC 14216 / KM-6054) TaxID=452652 RepID=E4N8M9_KITSK|nr:MULTISPECIES: DUF4259 domain-containing protein [Kitasatospora]BAJ27560.1 hypothetical protein KSE_17360 [Kitasatospora setae KM-6054]
MGSWDTGPFDNDDAADLGDELDEAAPERRAALVRAALTRALRKSDCLEHGDGLRAVAAAALVASHCPGGTPVTTAHGPRQPLPPLADLRPLAARAVARALGPDSELTEGWYAFAAYQTWRNELEHLQTVLRDPPPPTQATLF